MTNLVDSRRSFLQRIGATSVGVAAMPSLLAMASEQVYEIDWPEPLQVANVSQPTADVVGPPVFSNNNRHVAVSGGTAENLSLYVSLANTAGTFQRIWPSGQELTQIHSIAWAPNEEAIAFMATSLRLDDSPRHGELAIYIVDLGSMGVQKLITAVEQIGDAKNVTVDISPLAGLAWYDDNTIYCCGRDNTIFSVNRQNGALAEITQLPGNNMTSSFQRVGTKNIRFIRKNSEFLRDQGIAVEIDGIDDGQLLESRSIDTGNAGQVLIANLDSDGRHLLLHTLQDGLPRVVVFDSEQQSIIVNNIACAKSGENFYTYSPMTLRSQQELILTEMVLEDIWRYKAIADVANDEAADSDILPISVVSSLDPSTVRPKCRLVSLQV